MVILLDSSPVLNSVVVEGYGSVPSAVHSLPLTDGVVVMIGCVPYYFVLSRIAPHVDVPGSPSVDDYVR